MPRNENLQGLVSRGYEVEDMIDDVAARVETVNPLRSDSLIVERNRATSSPPGS